MSSTVSAFIISPSSDKARACEINLTPEGTIVSYVDHTWFIKRQVKLNTNDVIISAQRSLTSLELQALQKVLTEPLDKASPGIDLVDKRSTKKIGTICTDTDFKWVMAADMLPETTKQ